MLNSNTSSLITIPPPPQQQARGQVAAPRPSPVLSGLGGLGSVGGAGLGNDFLGLGLLQQQPVRQATPPVQQATPPLRPPASGGQPFPMAAPDPLAVLDTLTVALETIKPGGWVGAI